MEIPRVLASQGEDFLKLQLALDKLQRVQWIESMGPWDVMMTGTFRWQASVDSARRCFSKWIARKVPHVSYYYALEPNPSRDGYHVHSLWASARTVFRREMWADWFKRYGRCRIEPVRSKRDCSDYASKYLTKPNGWWDYFLQWDRRRRVNGETDFKLSEPGHDSYASVPQYGQPAPELPFASVPVINTGVRDVQWRRNASGILESVFVPPVEGL